MTHRSRPLLESLEGRRLLSKAGDPVPDLIQFATPSGLLDGPPVLASQQDSSVTLTLQRIYSGKASAAPTLQVQVSTVPTSNPALTTPRAVAGVQYRPISQTVTFPPGVTSRKIIIPIIPGAPNPGMLSFQVIATKLNHLNGSAPANSDSEVVDLTANSSVPYPKISGAHMVAKGKTLTDIILQFSMPMNPATVEDVNAYSALDTTLHDKSGSNFFDILSLFVPGSKNSQKPKPVAFQSATYDPATNSVDLHLTKPMDSRDTYEITNTSATPASPLLDATGTEINDNGTGIGGSFGVTLTSRKATIQTA